MVSTESQLQITLGSYLWYLFTTVAVFLLSVPLALLLAVAGIVKLLYPTPKEHE